MQCNLLGSCVIICHLVKFPLASRSALPIAKELSLACLALLCSFVIAASALAATCQDLVDADMP